MRTSWRVFLCRTKTAITNLAAVTLVAAQVAIAQPGPPAPPPPPPPAPPSQPPSGFGVPLTGLTSAQLSAFQAGLNQFQQREIPSTGLGPIFNRDSCVACHAGPAPGGSSPVTTTRFGQVTNGVFDPLISLGGSLLQSQAINPIGLEHIPAQANVTAQRETQPLFGLGLIEAIPDATILKGVRTTAVNGVLGRAAMVVDPVSKTTRVGRFGWKAQQATLLAFAGDAYDNEMGITNRVFPTENAPNGNLAILKQLDKVPDPEDHVDPATGESKIDRVTDFMRALAPPPAQAANASTAYGALFFAQVGCANCHTPSMTTGTSSISALSNQTIFLYSDLLLHDMGSLGDGIAQGAAGPREMRTAPLWGLKASAPYLHDGRAPTVDAAIRAHDGEAALSKSQYLQLNSQQQGLLIQFLNSN
jgi:CxxC motif-containing protein (DUF1111 family)